MKKCSMCKEEFPISFFYTDKTRVAGVNHRCKSCDKKLVVRRITKNRLNMNDTYWRLCGRQHKVDGYLLKNIFQKQDKKCFYCRCNVAAKNLHFDHFYPKQKSKIVIACSDCNRLKWERDGIQFMIFIKEYISRFS